MSGRAMRIAVVGLASGLFVGCGLSSGTGPSALLNADEVVFLSQQARPNANMEALFNGRVFLDALGCFRLDIPDVEELNTTVVWPFRASVTGQVRIWRIHPGSGPGGPDGRAHKRHGERGPGQVPRPVLGSGCGELLVTVAAGPGHGILGGEPTTSSGAGI